MKKYVILTLLSVLAVGATACTKAPADVPIVSVAPMASADPMTSADPMVSADPMAGKLKDGTYTATSKEYDERGWKGNVTIVVQNGMIVDCDWNGENKEGGDDKKTVSEKGEYGINWHEQAALAEAALISTQNPNLITLNAEGKTDAISGVSMNLTEFVTLSNEAIAQAL